MRQLYVRTFGGLRISDAGDTDIRLPTRKAAALIVYLSMYAGRRWPREALTHLFWGGSSDARARQSLRQALSEIRKICGPDLILTDGDYIWVNQNALRVDALEFDGLVKIGTPASLERAESLYDGDFLAFGELGQEAFDTWLSLERERLALIVQTALTKLIALRSGVGMVDKQIQTARTFLAIDPYNEQTHRVLMKAYAQHGQAALAIAHYERLRKDLRCDLGTAPDERTAAVHKKIVAEAQVQTFQPRALSQFAFVLEQLPHPVVVTDTDNHIVGWNGLAEEAFGFTKAEMCGRSPTLVYAPDRDQSLADIILRRALRTGQWCGDVDLVRKDGRRCRQRRIVAPLFGPSGELLGAFGHGLRDAQPIPSG